MKQTSSAVRSAILALVVAAFGGAHAGAQPSAKGLVRHVLKDNYYDASSSGSNPSCGAAGCIATATIYSERIPCLGTRAAICTYEINIAALTSVSQSGGGGNEGVYQFLIDGANPTGGGTDGSGYYAWGSAGGPAVTSTYTVTSQVTNTKLNELHSIVVRFGCSAGSDNTGGCSAMSGAASLTVRVLNP